MSAAPNRIETCTGKFVAMAYKDVQTNKLVLKLFYSNRTRVHFSISVLILEVFYGTRTRVHFSVSVLVLEVFCGTRTRKLSTRLHHCS